MLHTYATAPIGFVFWRTDLESVFRFEVLFFLLGTPSRIALTFYFLDVKFFQPAITQPFSSRITRGAKNAHRS
jgi:hypothetical protein